MKEGRVSSGLCSIGTSCGWLVLSLAHLSIAPSRVISWLGVAPVAQFGSGPSGGQGRGGACRSEGLVAGEHVPVGFGEPAGDLDCGDFGAALFAVAGLHSFADRRVGRVAAGGGMGCFDVRPAEIVGPVFAERAAPIALTGLVDARAEAGVADQFAGACEAVDVADLGGERVGERPADPGAGEQQRNVAVLGTELAQLFGAGVDP